MAGIFAYIWNLFIIWIETLFVVPIQNWEMLWLLVPVWLAWFFAEFYQEKVGTSIGNALTNAVVVLWGSIDCSRKTVELITSGIIKSTVEIIERFALIAAIFAYGTIIVVLGMKGKHIVRYIGRVRIVTYVFAMFVPVIYNAFPFSLEHFLATILFFPLFYFGIELIDRIIPDPKAIIEDMKDMKKASPKKEDTASAEIQKLSQLHRTWPGYPQNFSHPGNHQHNAAGEQYKHAHTGQHQNPGQHSPGHSQNQRYPPFQGSR